MDENKINDMLMDIYKFMDYDETEIYIYNGNVEIENNYDDLFELIHNIWDEIKNINFDNVFKYEMKQLSFDDYYCLFLYDEKQNIIKWVMWDFDFYIMNENEILNVDYRFSNCKNMNDVFKKFQ